jgi:hypothetical protein
MLKITEIVKDGILEISFVEQEHHTKLYSILCEKGSEIMKGKIDGFTQRTCLYIGELKKGIYQFQMNDQIIKKFEVL